MQYRYHEWTDKILSKRTAESIGSSTLIGLKCGFDIVTITRPSGSNPAKVVMGHFASPSNSIADRLHLTPEQQNTLTAIGCVITPDCVITTEDTPIEFSISATEWNSRTEHGWAVVATHNYIEIPESSTTLQGGSPTTYSLVNLMGVITHMGLQQFLDGYLYTDDRGKLIDLVHDEDAGITPVNSVVLGVIVNVQASNPTTSKYTPIYNNTTPILKRFTEYEYNDILESINGVITAITTLREDLETQMNYLREDLETHIMDKNNPHQVTKFQVGLGNLINSISNDHYIGIPSTLALETNFGVWKNQWVKHISFLEISKDSNSEFAVFHMLGWERKNLPVIHGNWLVEGTIQAYSQALGDQELGVGVIHLPQAVNRITIRRPPSTSSNSYNLELRYNGAALRAVQDEIGSGTTLKFVFILKITIPPYLMSYPDTPQPPI